MLELVVGLRARECNNVMVKKMMMMSLDPGMMSMCSNISFLSAKARLNEVTRKLRAYLNVFSCMSSTTLRQPTSNHAPFIFSFQGPISPPAQYTIDCHHQFRSVRRNDCCSCLRMRLAAFCRRRLRASHKQRLAQTIKSRTSVCDCSSLVLDRYSLETISGNFRLG